MTNGNTNPTAEQIVRATLLRCQFDTLGDKVADVVKDLRAHGLLAEGAPSEESAYLVTIKLPPNPDHNPRAKRTDACAIAENCTDSTGEHHTYLARSIEEVQRETRHITRIETIGAVASGAPSEEQIERAAIALWEIDDSQALRGAWTDETQAIRAGYVRMARLTLTAAGAAPLDSEKVAEVINAALAAWEGEERSEVFVARALCEAYTEGKLT